MSVVKGAQVRFLAKLVVNKVDFISSVVLTIACVKSSSLYDRTVFFLISSPEKLENGSLHINMLTVDCFKC